MDIRIALAGNPNCGKTTLFNALTGSNQYVGNWPGVTVEKKEGKMKNRDGVTFTDLPGIYSLSPYTTDEVVARDYLIKEHPDAILNIVDGTNIERNLYLTTQLMETGAPVVVAINMMDIVRKNGDKINIEELSKKLGCKIVEISALKNEGIIEAADAAIEAAAKKYSVPLHIFSGEVEHAIAHIEEAAVHSMAPEKQRWYAIKIFERDKNVLNLLDLSESTLNHIEEDIRTTEAIMDDDAESIITNERYNYISNILNGVYKKKHSGRLTASDKIDRIFTNKWAALPIFAVIMFLTYYISIALVGSWSDTWAKNGLFGDGWHLFGIGASSYSAAVTESAEQYLWTEEMREKLETAKQNDAIGAELAIKAMDAKDYSSFIKAVDVYGDAFAEKGADISGILEDWYKIIPDESDFGVWIPGLPKVIGDSLERLNTPLWLNGLILDGIVAGVGSVLSFLPQMFALFIFLAFLEGCGYMSRIAFVMDKIFRKFGLSGKSFIPILVGTGCGATGIMSSRTIENQNDRRMTIITTTFIPCGAKLPVIAMISSAIFGGAWWVAPSAYLIGIFAIVTSGFILKKTKMFSGEPSPFVMELPAYHMPTPINILRSMWERGWAFIKKAGTIILLASIFVWIGSSVGVVEGKLVFALDIPLESSILGVIGGALKVLFNPLGFGSAKASIATLMGILAKEEIVGVFGVLDFEGMTALSAYSFLIFNLLCAPCVGAISAISREMNSAKWTWFAIGYQCAFAYAVSLIVYQFGMMFKGAANPISLAFAVIIFIFMVYMVVRKNKNGASLKPNSAA
ncbi:MAG: ferrous iron transporter B [Oscillospiraceae bacterium]|nr:ferrous iron transporter B [Oscillospiraceae bacterium]